MPRFDRPRSAPFLQERSAASRRRESAQLGAAVVLAVLGLGGTGYLVIDRFVDQETATPGRAHEQLHGARAREHRRPRPPSGPALRHAQALPREDDRVRIYVAQPRRRRADAHDRRAGAAVRRFCADAAGRGGCNRYELALEDLAPFVLRRSGATVALSCRTVPDIKDLFTPGETDPEAGDVVPARADLLGCVPGDGVWREAPAALAASNATMRAAGRPAAP